MVSLRFVIIKKESYPYIMILIRLARHLAAAAALLPDPVLYLS